MIKIIGDGGHAKVVRDVINCSYWSHDDDEELAFVAIGNNADRRFESVRVIGRFALLVHPSAILGADLEIGDGTIIMAGAVVQAGTVIGKHCILNTNSSCDHDCTIGDYAHIAPGAVLCGNVTVGEGALIGAGAVCVPGAVIPPWSLVKAGTVAK